MIIGCIVSATDFLAISEHRPILYAAVFSALCLISIAMQPSGPPHVQEQLPGRAMSGSPATKPLKSCVIVCSLWERSRQSLVPGYSTARAGICLTYDTA